jgi:hypothetical protein
MVVVPANLMKCDVRSASTQSGTAQMYARVRMERSDVEHSKDLRVYALKFVALNQRKLVMTKIGNLYIVRLSPKEVVHAQMVRADVEPRSLILGTAQIYVVI